jgi:hypothetical protein
LDLVENCGTEAPDIEDYCTEQQLETCSEVVPILVAAFEKCGSGDGVETSDPTEASDTPDEPHAPPPATPEEFSALMGCCEALSQDPEAFQEFIDCLTDAGEDCEAMEACYEILHDGMGGGDYESTQKDEESNRANEDNADEGEKQSSGCSMAAGGIRRGSSLLSVLFDLV